MKISKFLPFVLFATLISPAYAENNTCPPQAHVPSIDEVKEALKHNQDRGFLWKITKDGHSSWLYGTIHIAKENWMMPGPTVLNAISKSVAVGVELDILNPENIKALQAPANTETQKWLDEKGLQKKIEDEELKFCTPTAQVKDMPLAARVTRMTASVGKWEGYYPDYGIDLVLLGFAKSTMRQIIELEDVATQRTILAGHDKKQTAQKIENYLNEIANGKALSTTKELAAVWEKSDLPGLEKFAAECDKTELCKATNVEIGERNNAMAKKLDDIHVGGTSIFTGVGFLHMVGPKGLPELMKKRGYTVEQILPSSKASL
ncbi:MAG: TraB/GumN family protein [Zymomonas mobilis]